MERQVVQGVTIDSEETRDIDDSLWIEFRDNLWHIIVSIADVAEAVAPGSKVDERAREMVTTKYYGTGNSPMLPRRFADDELSLWPGKKRRTVTVDVAVRVEPMEVVKTDIYLSTLMSRARCPYDRVPEILKDKEHEGHEMLTLGCKMAMQLLDARRKAGAMVLYDLNNGWVTTEDGFLRKLEKKEETVGYILIQEMMILANSKVAEFAVKNNIPVLFRNHMAMNAMPDRQVLMAQIEDALTTPMADLETVRQRTHMLLGRANYSDSLLGHYGLNLPAYVHFTSPIRRYADLVNHRQLKAHLEGKPLPYTKKDMEGFAQHINEVLENERQNTSMYFKTKDEEKAHRNIDARRLDGLDATHFERVTKVEVRSGNDPSDAFEEAFLHRLKENRVPLICLTVVLTQEGITEGWKPIRQAVLDHLAKRPEEAASLLAQAQGVAGWNLVDYAVAHEGPDHARTFTCEATLLFNGESVKADAKANTSKLAKQRAAVALLAKLHGLKVTEKAEEKSDEKPAEAFVAKEHEVVRLAVAMPDKHLVVGSTGCVVHVYSDAYEVEFITSNGHEVLTLDRSEVMPLSAPVPAENLVKAPSLDKGKDPVSALMEYSQKTKAAPPEFQYVKTGPDHIPVITCTCSFGPITKKATASSKQDAKKQAASLVIAELQPV